jgi:hypothetical protein
MRITAAIRRLLGENRQQLNAVTEDPVLSLRPTVYWPSSRIDRLRARVSTRKMQETIHGQRRPLCCA